MTREVINELKKYTVGKKNSQKTEISVLALNRLIFALEEQEPDLDKITTEIMQLDYDLESVDYDYNDMAQTEVIHMICREEVLQIIDKYRKKVRG